MNKEVLRKIRKILIVLLIIWMVGVFLLSNQRGTESSSLSKKFALILCFGNEETADNFEPLVRKIAHIIEYAIGAMIFYGILCTYPKIPFQAKVGITMAFIIVYAGSDELHQLYIDSRNGSYMDVGIDAVGGALGLAACYLLGYLINIIDTKVQEEVNMSKLQ